MPSLVPVDLNNPTPDKLVLRSEVSIADIIMAGSVIEDEGARSTHHFYDVLHGGASANVDVLGQTLYDEYSSREWTLEAQRSGDPREINEQEFSYRDAVSYFYDALTVPGNETRREKFGLLFRSLGHVIHHVQDMAQPQHVRNDDHCDASLVIFDFPENLLCLSVHNPSLYEEFTNSVRDRIDLSSLDIAVPELQLASDIWTNDSMSGLAEYTATNFVSDGTNFRKIADGGLAPHPLYELPVPLADINSERLEDLIQEDPYMTPEKKQKTLANLGCDIPGIICEMDFVQTVVTDPAGFQPEQINRRASSVSIFDDELRRRNLRVAYATITGGYETERLFALNRYNFIEAHKYLLSRAIAYGAAMINYFFRGRMQVERATFGSDGRFHVSLRNISSGDNHFSEGGFEIYYDRVGGDRARITEVEIQGGNELAAGDLIDLVFDLPVDVDANVTNPLHVVYQGKIGREAGVAAAAFGGAGEMLFYASGSLAHAQVRVMLDNNDQVSKVLLNGNFMSDDDLYRAIHVLVRKHQDKAIRSFIETYIGPLQLPHPVTNEPSRLTLAHAAADGEKINLLYAFTDYNENVFVQHAGRKHFEKGAQIPGLFLFSTTLADALVSRRSNSVIAGNVIDLQDLTAHLAGDKETRNIFWRFGHPSWGMFFSVMHLDINETFSPPLTALWGSPSAERSVEFKIHHRNYRIGAGIDSYVILEEFPNVYYPVREGSACVAGFVGAVYDNYPTYGKDINYLPYSLTSTMVLNGSVVSLYDSRYSSAMAYTKQGPSLYPEVNALGGCGDQHISTETEREITHHPVFEFPQVLPDGARQIYSPDTGLTYQLAVDNSYRIYHNNDLLFTATSSGPGQAWALKDLHGLPGPGDVEVRAPYIGFQSTISTVFAPTTDYCPEVIPVNGLPCTYYYTTINQSTHEQTISMLGKDPDEYGEVFGESYISSLPVGYGHSSSIIYRPESEGLCVITFKTGYQEARTDYLQAKAQLDNADQDADIASLEQQLSDARQALNEVMTIPLNNFASYDLILLAEPGKLYLVM